MSTVTRRQQLMSGLASSVAAEIRQRRERHRAQPAEIRDSDRRRGDAAAVLLKVLGLTAVQREELKEEKLSPVLPGALDLARSHAQEAMTALSYGELDIDVRGALRHIGLAEYPSARTVLFNAALAVAASDILTADERYDLAAAWSYVLSRS
jgi:hypothetical protein